MPNKERTDGEPAAGYDSFSAVADAFEATWAAPLRSRVGILLWRRKLHEDFRSLLKARNVRSDDLFWVNFHQMYLDAQLIAVRRLVDDDQRTVSVRRFLGQLNRQQRLFKRSHFVERYVASLMAGHAPGSSEWDVWETVHRESAERAFDQFATLAKPSFASQIPVDAELLDKASSQIILHVNTYVAHATAESLPPEVTYNDLDKAINIVDELVCKYSLLVRGSTPETTLPTAQFDAFAIFQS